MLPTFLAGAQGAAPGPRGVVHQNGIASSTTTLNYTGQRRDDTGLVYYHARYYDPRLGRFLSPDTLVPSTPEGSMDGVAHTPLTVAFHDPAFTAALGQELRASERQRDTLHGGGPFNPQDLNRYSYARNNPVRYTDPSGHLAWVAGAAVIGAGINIVGHVATQKLSGEGISPGSIAQAAVSGAIGGALTAVGGPIAGVVAGKIGTVAATAGVSFIGSVFADVTGTTVGLGVNQMMGIHDENLTFDPVKMVVGAAVDTVAIGPLAGSWDPPGMHTWRGARNAMEGRSIRAKYQREQQHNLRHNRTVLRMNVAASTTAGVVGSGAYDIVSRHRQSTIE